MSIIRGFDENSYKKPIERREAHWTKMGVERERGGERGRRWRERSLVIFSSQEALREGEEDRPNSREIRVGS
jgi:hypothetical protein